MECSHRPIIFDHNRITRSYIGGKLLNAWRGMPEAEDNHQCEELLVTSIGAIADGKPKDYAVSRTLDGTSLAEIIRQDPEGILGRAYQESNPNQLSVLARAGDTIVRLVMQCHPQKKDAFRFHERHGKAEAWYIARTRTEDGVAPCVYAGFKPHVTPALWKKWVESQNIEAMLEGLHKIDVKTGDVILIPAGMPHAVGPGCIFLEIHECSDITIRVEKHINGVDLSASEMYNGLDQEEGLKLFDYTVYDEAEIRKTCVMEQRDPLYQGNSVITTAIDERNTEAFGMKILTIQPELRLPAFDGHRVLIPVDGDLILECDGEQYKLKQGWGCLLPAALGTLTLRAEKGTAKAVLGLPGKISHE